MKRTWTATFSDLLYYWFLANGTGLLNRTVESGLYDRCAFEGTLEQWAEVHAAMAVARVGSKGSEKRTWTCAMQRVPTSEWVGSRRRRS